ncbi:ECF transporter S component [Fusibacter sp. 3D3]|uniref:ECF transporter S component n=1 Tax=Fusibacter sp. 3D3 TaxID=1048380 RepID=UPI0008529B78|nr:ECF transporter S component [Fusibacter sp. 3D3]GAU77629.1 substrate-specific component PdxU2 of predicted pyridoxin-related ECF transporter [Fusibacter sp. 3D3]
MKNNLKLLIYTALMTAFVFITTSIIKIPIPFTNGYIHAGDMCIFISGILLGPWYGAFAAGVGSMFADVLGGYAQWAIPTLIIKGVMGFIVGYFASEKRNQKHILASALGIWFVSLIGFVFSIKGTDVHFLATNVDALSGVDNIVAAISKLNYQLLGVAIIIPLITVLFYLLKDKYGITFGQLSGMIIAGLWMVLGYYLAASIMYGSFIVPIFSIPWNIIQFVGGIVLGFIILAGLKKANVSYVSLHHSHL